MLRMRSLLLPAALWTLLLGLSAQLVAQGGSSSAHVFYTSASGHVIQLYGFDGSWYYSDPTALSGGPTTSYFNQPMTSFTDSLGNHVFYLAESGSVAHVFQLYYQFSSGTWLSQDITAAAGGPEPGYGLTGFEDSLGEHVFYEGVDEHIHQLYGHNGWTDQDLTALSHATAEPGLESPLTSFADSLGEHLFYTGTGHHVRQLYGNNGWSDQDLTALSDAPLDATTQSPLASFSDSYGEHLFYIGTDYRVHQLYGDNGWTDQDLMPNSLDLAAAGFGSLTGFSDSVGEHVFLLTADGDTPNYDVLELCGCDGEWQLSDLTQETSGAYPHQAFENGPVVSFSQGSGSSTIEQAPYLGLATAGESTIDVYVEWWTPSAGWNISNLNALTGAPSANMPDNGNLTGFVE
jgi:hypothetical protein